MLISKNLRVNKASFTQTKNFLAPRTEREGASRRTPDDLACEGVPFLFSALLLPYFPACFCL